MTDNGPTSTRRTAIGVVLTVGPASFAGSADAATPQGAPTATFVLVHGAWHGGWCWERVATRLQALGHRVYAPTLTGLGERSHLLGPEINLSTHIADIVNEIRWKDLNNIVLVGHSYGGMVISGVAEKVGDRIGSIVYLDAFVPRADNLSLHDISGAKIDTTKATVPLRTAASFNVNGADRAWVDSKMTPQPMGTFLEKLPMTFAYKRVPKRTYIQAVINGKGSFDWASTYLAGEPGWAIRKVESGHDVMIDQPDTLSSLLEAAIPARAG